MSIALDIPEKFQGLFQRWRYHCYYGGRGGAKTVSIARALIAKSYTEKCLILCAREYQNSILDSVHRVLSAEIWALGLAPWFEVLAKTIRCKTTGSEFIFKGLHNNIDEIKSLHGVRYLWIEEAQSVGEESWIRLDPTIRENDSEIIISFNPDSDRDPTYVRFVTKPPSNAEVVKVNWRDNKYFPEVLEVQRKQMLENDPDNYDWVWEGECRQLTDAAVYHGKLLIKPFDENPEPRTRFYFGLDFGYSVDPTALIRCYIKPSEEGHGEDLIIDREAYAYNLELDEMGKFFDNSIENVRDWHIKADNARPECISYLSRQGFQVSAAEKWQGSVEDGIAHLRAFRKIIIHERLCPNTARDFRLYSYKVDRKSLDQNGKPQVLPVLKEGSDHACIARDELIDTKRGFIPVQDVVVGDLVRTRKGYKRVYCSQFNGTKPTLRIMTRNNSLLATHDHRIYTVTQGFSRADALSYTDHLVVRGVPMPVNQHGVERADGMMKFVSVLSALKNLVLISTAKLNVAHEAVEHVEDGGLREVYDLSVEDVPEFYASNILVHNCDAGRYALSDFIQMRGGIGVWRKLLGRT